jgi:signal transduction histidine kinase
MVGQPLASIFTERDRALGLDKQEIAVADRLGASEDDRWHLRCDGTRFWAIGALRAIRDESGAIAGYVKMLRDRTDLRAQIDTTAHRLGTTEAALAVRKRQLATAAHELRGPLSAITAATLAMEKAELSPDMAERLREIIGRQLKIATRLVGDAMDGAEDDEAGGVLDPQQTVLQRILDSAAETVRASSVGAGRTIELIMPEAPLVLHIDAVRVEQVFRNLVENACKYNEPGGHVWVTATLEADTAVVRVRDDGIGISNEMLPHIFDWFVRGDDDAAGATQGLGVGLGVVRDLVHRLHGTVEVLSSGVHGGSEFTVNLPIRPRAAAHDG